MSRFFDNKYSELKPYTPGEQPRNMDRFVKLNTNENPYPPAPALLSAVNAKNIGALKLYSDPTCKKIKQAIADFYDLEVQNVSVSNGSDEILSFIFQGFTQNGVAVNDITYGFYKVFCDVLNIDKKVVPLKDDFTIDITDYEGYKGTVVIANPNAPTGIDIGLPAIEGLLLQDKDRLVVVDEAYVDFGAESSVKLLKEYDNLLIVQTFSKSRSMAGARIGYALGSKDVIADLEKLRYSFNPYNLDSLSIILGTAALSDRAYFDSCRHSIIQNRVFLTSELRAMGFKVFDSRANFVFAGIPHLMSGRDFYLALKERDVLVRYLDEPRLKDYVRISVGSTEQIETLLKVTRQILN